jgi:hypothetical protein
MDGSVWGSTGDTKPSPRLLEHCKQFKIQSSRSGEWCWEMTLHLEVNPPNTKIFDYAYAIPGSNQKFALEWKILKPHVQGFQTGANTLVKWSWEKYSVSLEQLSWAKMFEHVNKDKRKYCRSEYCVEISVWIDTSDSSCTSKGRFHSKHSVWFETSTWWVGGGNIRKAFWRRQWICSAEWPLLTWPSPLHIQAHEAQLYTA